MLFEEKVRGDGKEFVKECIMERDRRRENKKENKLDKERTLYLERNGWSEEGIDVGVRRRRNIDYVETRKRMQHWMEECESLERTGRGLEELLDEDGTGLDWTG
jgi:hypothetical protein